MQLMSLPLKLSSLQLNVESNQAIAIPNIKYIFITDSLHVAKRIFDLLLYPYQIHSAAIS